jgi:hypothetical protein
VSIGREQLVVALMVVAAFLIRRKEAVKELIMCLVVSV